MERGDASVRPAGAFTLLVALSALSLLGLRRSSVVAQSMPQTGQAPAQPSRTAPLAFHGVTVIDVRTGRLLSDQTVVIVGRQIQTVGPRRRVRVPASARVVDARGRYLIPGLWDMELYLGGVSPPLMQLLIANGVTGYRNLGADGGGVIDGEKITIDSMRRWRQEVVVGTRVGPRILIGGPRLDGCRDSVHQVNPNSSIGLCTSERARYLVDSLQATGADHIFVYNSSPMKREIAFAILAEARRRHIPVVGHLPDSLTLAEASDSGMHAVDHLGGTGGICYHLRGTSTADDSVRESASVERCAGLAKRLRRNNTWVAVGPFYFVGAPARLTDELIRQRLQYYPRRLRAPIPDSGVVRREGHTLPSDLFAIIDSAGLPILLASDKGALAQSTGPGFQLHYDLAIAVEHGLSPLTALQAVTLNAAKYLGGTDSLGTVERGKLADLVLLDANPLEDIYNTQRIQAVVTDGRYFSRAALDSLLQQAGTAE